MTGSDFYTWRTQSFTVRITLDLIDRINLALARASESQNEEQGGILLGKAVAPNLVEITAFEFVRSEHHRGIAYDLGTRERDRVTRYVQRLRRGRSSSKPVGFFRTHHRPGLFLDQDDFALMSEAFHDPSSVALAIRPDGQGHATAGFFFWENNDIDRKQSRLAFAFDKNALRPERVPQAVPAPRVRPAFRPAFRIPAWQAMLAASVAAIAGFSLMWATESKPRSAANPQIAVTVEAQANAMPGTFQPAQPTASLTPVLPQRLVNSLAGELPVDLKVSVDKKGIVRTTEALNGAGSRLASLAADNVFYTPWRPARIGSESVDSELVLHYRLSQASAARR